MCYYHNISSARQYACNNLLHCLIIDRQIVDIGRFVNQRILSKNIQILFNSKFCIVEDQNNLNTMNINDKELKTTLQLTPTRIFLL